MARVTVEDCIEHLPNRFELVIVAAHRAKQIASGTPLTIDRDNDKDAVVALREIADTTIDIEQSKEDLIQAYCRKQVMEAASQPEPVENEEVKALLAEEGEVVNDDASDHLSVAVTGKNGLSFEGDNVEVED